MERVSGIAVVGWHHVFVPPPAQIFIQPHIPKGHCFYHGGGPLLAAGLPFSQDLGVVEGVWEWVAWGRSESGTWEGHRVGGMGIKGWGWRDSVGGMGMKRMEVGTGTEGQRWRGMNGGTVVAGGLGQEEWGRQGIDRARRIGKKDKSRQAGTGGLDRSPVAGRRCRSTGMGVPWRLGTTSR